MQGPQYVCTNYWTFVCMTCSGIRREFTHRVKSVSMSKFTSQEVEALQEGGNQRARETFLKDWDPREQRLPDNSNVDKVREFIKSVYVDKKFFASKTSGKPPRDTFVTCKIMLKMFPFWCILICSIGYQLFRALETMKMKQGELVHIIHTLKVHHMIINMKKGIMANKLLHLQKRLDRIQECFGFLALVV